MEITTRAGKEDDARVIKVSPPYPATFDEKVEYLGQAVAESMIDQAFVLAVQAKVRPMLKAIETKDGEDFEKYSDEDIIDAAAGYKPGVKTVRTGDKKSKIIKDFGSLSEEDREALLAELRAGTPAGDQEEDE